MIIWGTSGICLTSPCQRLGKGSLKLLTRSARVLTHWSTSIEELIIYLSTHKHTLYRCDPIPSTCWNQCLLSHTRRWRLLVGTLKVIYQDAGPSGYIGKDYYHIKIQIQTLQNKVVSICCLRDHYTSNNTIRRTKVLAIFRRRKLEIFSLMFKSAKLNRKDPWPDWVSFIWLSQITL